MNIKKILCKIFGHKNEITVVGITDTGSYYIKKDKCARCGSGLPIAHPYSIQYMDRRS